MLFNVMKSEVGETIKKYGAENPPPPSQVYTIKNAPGEGNLHYVQKVFMGAFEVRCLGLLKRCSWLTPRSSIFFSHLDPLRNP